MNNLKDKPFALIGVHIGGADAKVVKKLMDEQKLPWRTFVDTGNAGAGPIATKWNLSATPSFYLIDAQGVIRRKWAGAPGEKVVDAAVEEALKAAEGSGKPGSR